MMDEWMDGWMVGWWFGWKDGVVIYVFDIIENNLFYFLNNK